MKRKIKKKIKLKTIKNEVHFQQSWHAGYTLSNQEDTSFISVGSLIILESNKRFDELFHLVP